MLPQRLEERRAWLRRGFARAVEYALEQRVHLFLQAGDLFDAPEPRNLERQFVAEALARLRAAGVRCLGVGGNHDTPRARGANSPATPQSTYARLGGLRLLGEHPALNYQPSAVSTQNPAPSTQNPLSPQSPVLSSTLDTELFEIEGVRLAVGGIAPDPTAAPGSDPLEGLSWRPEADLALLMLHGSLEGHLYPGADEPFLRRRTVEGLEGVDLLVVGHVHRYAAFRWGGTTVVVPGATERMTFADAEEPPGFAYLEMEPGRAVASRRVVVEAQPRRQMVIRTPELAEGDPLEIVSARLDSLCHRDALVRLSLEGPISRQRYHDLQLRRIADVGASQAFFFELDTTRLYLEDEALPHVARGGRLSQREELIRFAEESRQMAATQEERVLIDEALRTILEGYG